jgi:predicted component of type VI protein secretion system
MRRRHGNPILPTMTEARRAWLTCLRDHGPHSREGRGRTPHDCMALGWAEWLVRYEPEHAIMTWAEAKERFGNEAAEMVAFTQKEAITQAGLAALAEGESHGHA